MNNGNYAVSFTGPAGSGSGSGVVRNGTINGGDASYGYMGKVTVQGDKVTAALNVKRHTPTQMSVFGPLTEFKLDLAGTVTNGNEFTMTGGIPGQPTHKITIRGRKYAELVEA